MKIARTTKAFIFAAMALGVVFAGHLFAQPTPTPLAPVKIHGLVTVRIELLGTDLNLWVHVEQAGQALSGLAVALMGQKAGETDPGEYVCLINGFNPVPGLPVNVTFDQKPKTPVPNPTFPLTAQAAIGTLIRYVSPKPEDKIHLTPLGMLNIVWTGGQPPYKIIIQPFKDPDIFEGEIFHKEGILGTNMSVPMALFKPGQRYAIFAIGTMSKFTFNKPVDDSTPFELAQRVRINISTD